MAVKIRLQRHGKKGKPFYWIVAADARSKRDGKYLEKIGTYDPNQKPASIDLDFDSALSWLAKGAQPTSTAKAILSYTGVLLLSDLNSKIPVIVEPNTVFSILSGTGKDYGIIQYSKKCEDIKNESIIFPIGIPAWNKLPAPEV